MKSPRDYVIENNEPATMRSEQIFFDDPAVDRVMGVLFSLAQEHYVLHDRVRALEELLVEKGVVSAEALNAPPRDEAAAHRDAAEFAEALLRPILGVQTAKGLTGRFSLARGKAQ
ncbi:MAG: hypothetical protein C0P74_007890 [Gammaproteobacteria bacterium]|nr:hypothetical protein [Gammaproteobacteria bacterium]